MERPFKPRNTPRAKQLRNEASPAERRLWPHLSSSQLGGYKFSRQIQIGPFYGDFVCRTMKLVIELDGMSHDVQANYDIARTSYLESIGYTVMRFSNSDVFSNIEGVLVTILEALETLQASLPTPNPSRLREGDS
jgi:very-short-patch-repair endonuclease